MTFFVRSFYEDLRFGVLVSDGDMGTMLHERRSVPESCV